MTAVIIPFRLFRARLRWWQHTPMAALLPSAIEVAMEHMLWARDRGMTPRQVGASIGVVTTSWSEVVRALAQAWEELPEETRRGE